MFVRNHGPVLTAIPQPFWDAPNDAAAAAAATGGTPGAAVIADTPASGTVDDATNGSGAFDHGTAYAALDEGTRNWLQTKDLLSDPAKLAKSAYEQEKMLGGSIRLPGKDATPEEKDAFYNKLGRPATPDGYEFNVPADLPEGLPYDGERAKALKAELHAKGFTKEQAAFVHDRYIAEITGMASGTAAAQQAEVTKQAEGATDALVKRWGPLDSDTAKANFELADRVFTDVPGGQEFLVELTKKGFVGENKVVLSEPIAVFLANLGGALFKEDNVLRGNPDSVGNPFSDGESNNLTAQMNMVKSDPDRARSLIAAAGKQPSAFGLK